MLTIVALLRMTVDLVPPEEPHVGKGLGARLALQGVLLLHVQPQFGPRRSSMSFEVTVGALEDRPLPQVKGLHVVLDVGHACKGL